MRKDKISPKLEKLLATPKKPVAKKASKNVCKDAPDKAHCFHSKSLGFGTTYALYQTPDYEQYCCFCDMKESDLHGPNHPLKPKAPITNLGTAFTVQGNHSIKTYTVGYTSPAISNDPTKNQCNGGNSTSGCKCDKPKIDGVCQG